MSSTGVTARSSRPLFKVLASGITGLISQFFTNRREKQQQVHTTNMAVLTNKQRLAEDKQSHNNAKEMKQLEVASPWMRRIVAAHVLILIDIAVINPAYANKIFTSLDNVPDWVIGLFGVVFGFYLALNKLSDYGAGLVQTWRKTPKE